MLTEGIAVYGAVVATTATLWNVYRWLLERPALKVEISLAVPVLTQQPGKWWIDGWRPERPRPAGLPAPVVDRSRCCLSISGCNTRRRPVTLTYVGFVLPGKVKLLPPLDDLVGFPVQLSEGMSHTVRLPMTDLRSWLEACDGAPPAYAFFGDATGRKYKARIAKRWWRAALAGS